ncbi:hypothetical protein SAMN06296241_1177 [Salinimicrobium sediminis]|uniref:DUF2281 domain-containing protein n=1 Tax=Salinimicrobium sediminis TaxID=1343891 RepID=A0A285X3S8_9FLAO|nr:hypothetical protein SAMN06296241_1177 [Salinimicrobium sediminis]
MEPNIKIKIVKLLDEMPEDLLKEVYIVLENYVEEKPNKLKLSRNLNKILEEDQNLLQRLSK